MRNKRTVYILISIFLLVLFISTILILTRNLAYEEGYKKAEKEIKKEIVAITASPTPSPRVNPTYEVTIDDPLTPVVIRPETSLPDKENNVFTSDNGAQCQPLEFDPLTAKYQAEPNSENFYNIKVSEEEVFYFGIDGFPKTKPSPKKLVQPFALKEYVFGCASTFSYVLEISKSGQRIKLLNHVNKFALSSDSTKIYFAQMIKDGNKWKETRQVYNIEKNTNSYLIKESACSEKVVFGSEDYLIGITGGYGNFSEQKSYFCIWNSNGNLVNKLSATNLARGGSNDNIYSQFGLLPSQKETVFIFTYSREKESDYGNCSLFLYDTKTNKSKSYDLGIPHFNGYCRMTEFDFKNQVFASNSIRFRYELEDSTYSTWRTISFD